MHIYQNPNKKLILWNKLSDNSSVQNSIIYPKNILEAIAGSPDYESCKFETGVELNSTSKYVVFQNLPSLNEKGTVEIWIKTLFAYSTGSDRFLFDTYSGSTGNRFFIYYHQAQDKWYTGFRNTADDSYYYAYSAVSSHSIGDLIHIAVSWDVNGLSGTSDIFNIYVDNTPGTANTNSDIDPDLSNDLYMGTNGSFTSSTGYSIFDNLKIYNYGKTDFSDRHIENPIKLESPKIYSVNRDILFSRLDNSNDIDDKISNFTFTEKNSPTYQDAYHNKGIYSKESDESHLEMDQDFRKVVCSKYNEGDYQVYAFTLEGWFNFKDYAIVNGYESPSSGKQRYLFSWGRYSGGNKYHMQLNFDHRSGKGFLFNSKHSSGNTVINDETIDISNGENVHMAVVHDKDGIAGSNDTIRVYVNGSNFMSSTATTDWDLSDGEATFKVGCQFNKYDATERCSNLVHDNLKAHNYAKTDFSDRFQEGLNYVFNKNILRNPNKKYIFWNRLGTGPEVANSEIGNGLTEVYTDAIYFTDGKFGKGVSRYNETTGGCVLKNTNQIWNTEEGTIEFYVKHFAYPIGFQYGVYNYLWWVTAYECPFFRYWPVWASGESDKTTDGRLRFRPCFGQGNQTSYTMNGEFQHFWDPSNPEWIHVAVTWNINKASSERVQFYINGVPQGCRESTQSWTTNGTSYVSQWRMLGGADSSWPTAKDTTFAMDNLKISTFEKTDFSDIEIEEVISLKYLEVIPEQRR